jgi:hypothetical protein
MEFIMIDVVEITINEFKENIYDKYIKLFPKDEQRNWGKIEKTYKDGIEKFYKIILKDMTIGFFMLEKLSDNYPFYIDYFAIFNEFQNEGYGTKAMQILGNKITDGKGLIAEIEKENINNGFQGVLRPCRKSVWKHLSLPLHESPSQSRFREHLR